MLSDHVNAVCVFDLCPFSRIAANAKRRPTSWPKVTTARAARPTPSASERQGKKKQPRTREANAKARGDINGRRKTIGRMPSFHARTPRPNDVMPGPSPRPSVLFVNFAKFEITTGSICVRYGEVISYPPVFNLIYITHPLILDMLFMEFVMFVFVAIATPSLYGSFSLYFVRGLPFVFLRVGVLLQPKKIS